MKDQNFTRTLTVNQTPEEAFAAINNVRGWWSEDITGDTDKMGSEWRYRYKDVHLCHLKIEELTPNKKVVWQVLDNYFSFTKNKAEWTGTKIVFDIKTKGDKTEVQFTHVGLVPEEECYAACSEGWSTYVNHSLRDLIAKGEGHPNVGKAMTNFERTL